MLPRIAAARRCHAVWRRLRGVLRCCHGFTRREQGASLVLVVLFLPALLLVAGAVTDLGILFVSRHLAYHAAELGALAGAQDVDLDALEQGDLQLLGPQATAAAEDYARRNLSRSFPRLDLGQDAAVHVQVYNASAAAPVRHRDTGRLLVDPTVSVAIRLDVPLHFLRPLKPWAELHVHADASVRTRHPAP